MSTMANGIMLTGKVAMHAIIHCQFTNMASMET